MADPTIQDILNEMGDEITGNPPGRLLESKLRSAISDVCERTWAWQEEIGPLYVKSEQTEYEIIPTYKYTWPIGIEWVKFKDVKLAADQYKLAGNILVLTFTPREDVENGLRVLVALSPDRTNQLNIISEEFYTEARAAIRAKFLLELKLMPDRPWSAPEQASYYFNLYSQEIARMRRHMIRGRRRLPQTMRISGAYTL